MIHSLTTILEHPNESIINSDGDDDDDQFHGWQGNFILFSRYFTLQSSALYGPYPFFFLKYLEVLVKLSISHLTFILLILSSRGIYLIKLCRAAAAAVWLLV